MRPAVDCPWHGCTRTDEHRHCTYRGCVNPPTKQLQRSDGGRPWYGCPDHWPAMDDALHYGLSGAATGSGWVEVTNLPECN